MKNKPGRMIMIPMLVIVLFLASGCDLENLDVGPVQTESRSVEPGSAEIVQAEIKMGAGELRINGGANSLMDAEFTYNVDEWKPEVDYLVDDGQGTLLVKQPSVEKKFPFDIDDLIYEWDVRFNDGYPLDLQIFMGAGEGDLELDSLQLQSLDFEGGAGSVEMDLSGSTVQDLAVKMGAGEVYLDLSGRWEQDLVAVIQGGIGSARLRLPEDVGVRVEVHRGLGEINASGFNKNGDVYTNDAYGESDITLDIVVQGGIGSIDLLLVE